MKDNFLKKYGAYLVAAVLFFVLAYAYCYPVLQGKVLYAGDHVTAAAAIHEGEEYTRTTGDHSWWTGSMFCGMPNYQIGGGEYMSAKWLAPLDAVLHRGHGHTAWVFIIYFFCFFALLRSFGVDKWISIAGAIAIALSSYFVVIIAAGHGGKTSTIALMSVVFAGFYLIFRKKYGLGIIFSMVFTAIGFSTHPQMAYYIFMMMGLCWFAELAIHINEKRMKDFGIATLLFAASVAVGMGTNCANVFANAEYTTQTMRGGHSDLAQGSESSGQSDGLDIDYATQWSYGIDETMSLLIPGFKGGANGVDVGTESGLFDALVSNGVSYGDAGNFCSSAPMYWGEQPFTAGNVYVGAVVVFLFVLGLFIVKGPYKWALLIATLFSIFLSWGHNWMGMTEFFFKYFPLYNKFRAVSSILIVAEIAMPLLGFLALKQLCEGGYERKKILKSVAVSGGITGFICLFFAFAGSSIFDFRSSYDAQFSSQIPGWLYNAILDERAHLFRSDCLRSFLFVALACGAVSLFAAGKMKKMWFAAILCVLVVADMWPVDRRYMNDSNFIPSYSNGAVFAKQEWEKAVLTDPDPHFRVFNCTVGDPFSDARTSYYLKSIGGYNAAKLRRYQDMIDVYLKSGNIPVLGMLNAKYFIIPGETGSPAVQQNPYALGNAWFVGNIRKAATPDEEMALLGEMNLASEAVVGDDFSGCIKDFEPGIAEDASIRLTKYTPKSLDYEYSTSAPGTLVFSEIYYPFGWKASIDGAPAEHFRANYTLRAMNVPSGNHSIHFEFDPDSVRKGDRIAMACVFIMYAACLAIIAISIVRKRKGNCLR